MAIIATGQVTDRLDPHRRLVEVDLAAGAGVGPAMSVTGHGR